MLENGFSRNYIERRFGISGELLGYLWTRYRSEGPTGLLKKQNVRVDYAFKQELSFINTNSIGSYRGMR